MTDVTAPTAETVLNKTPDNTITQQAADDVAALLVVERDSLKARATLMGISYPANVPTETLRKLITAALNERAVEDNELASGQQTPALTARDLARKEALRLVRINITPMNPALNNEQGTIITAANRSCPTQRKFVLFGTTDGYHVPNIIYQHLREMQYQRFYKETVNGVERSRSAYAPAFAIEVLPPLTQDEIAAMRLAQNAAKQGV